MNKSVIKWNLEVHSAIVLKFGSTTMRPYKYEVHVDKGLNVSIKPDVVNKSVIITVGKQIVSVSTVQYDHLLIVVANQVGVNKRQLFVNLMRNIDSLIVFNKSLTGSKFGMKKGLRANFQQDPTMMKKGKYLHRLKAFWTKRSDLPRGKYSHEHRFKTLIDSQIDAKLSRSYNSKFISIKFLSWKLDMSIRKLQRQLALCRMSNGNTTLNFVVWLNSRLAHILVLAGFYDSYTAANFAIRAGDISINGVIVKDINSTAAVGSLITVANVTSSIQRNVDGLLINYNSGSIFVKAIPNSLNSRLVQLDSASTGEIDSTLLDPMAHWLNYTASFLSRGFTH